MADTWPHVEIGHEYTCTTPFAYTQYGKNLEIHSTEQQSLSIWAHAYAVSRDW